MLLWFMPEDGGFLPLPTCMSCLNSQAPIFFLQFFFPDFSEVIWYWDITSSLCGL